MEKKIRVRFMAPPAKQGIQIPGKAKGAVLQGPEGVPFEASKKAIGT
jgi:hypothetical protein